MAEAVVLCRQEGLHTSLKPEEALISTIGGTKTCHSLYGTKLRHPDNTTIVDVDKGLLY